MIKVLYSGSFDPITKGHMNIVKQINKDISKYVVPTVEERMKLKKRTLKI